MGPKKQQGGKKRQLAPPVSRSPSRSRSPSPPLPPSPRIRAPPYAGGTSPSSSSSHSSEHGLRVISNSIQRFHQRLTNWNPTSLDEVTAKTTSFEELRSGFASWQQLLQHSLSTMEDAPAVIDTLSPSIDQCETQIEACHVTLLGHRSRLSSTTLSTSSYAPPTESKSAFKLERLKVPTFNGDFTQWESYRDLFSSAVHTNNALSKSEKMFYLRNSLKGDALSPIANFPVTASSYDEAWALVVKRYSNLREILFSHLRKFDSLTAADDSAIGIRKITDNLNEMTRSLKSHNTPVEHWDVIIVYWTVQKLHKETKRQWLLDQEGTEAPVLSDLVEFLEHRARALSDSQEKKGVSNPQSKIKNHKNKPAAVSAATEAAASSPSTSAPKKAIAQAKFPCIACKETHFLFQCQVFAHLSLPAKIKLLNEKELCHNCFKKHPTKDCTSKFKCRTCQGPHHTLLHPATPAAAGGNSSPPQSSSSSVAPSNPTAHVSESHHGGASISNALLETALVYAQRTDGSMRILRVFLDRGSEINFISESCSKELGLRPKGLTMKISGALGTECGSTKGNVTLTLHSAYSNFRLPANFEVVEKLTQGNLPRHTGTSDLPHVQGLQLADPLFYKPQPVDILLGSVSISLIRKDGLVLGPKGTPNAEATHFGWILGGAIPTAQQPESYLHSCYQVFGELPATEPLLEQTLLKFWETEEPQAHKIPRSQEDAYCEDFFVNTTYRQPDGRYVVRLPFKPDYSPLQDSLQIALRRFYCAERRCERDPILQLAYQKHFKDHLAAGIMEVVPPDEISLSPQRLYYMPYSHVLKESSTSTKLRIVYDCSAGTRRGPSLNEILCTGTKLIVDLIPLLIRFRSYPIALSADIEKFFNQFGLHQDDRDFQRLLFREEPNHPIQHLRMCRLTFGGTPFPFLASRALNQLFSEEEASDRAKEVISRETLVDNVLTGAFSIPDAIVLQVELDSVMKKGQLKLTKWASNHPDALASVPESCREVTGDLNISENLGIPTLGLRWNPQQDAFFVVIPPLQFPEIPPTKRIVLSQIARIYDPLGWISPVTVRPKLLLQKLWKSKLDWDTPLPAPLAVTWKGISKDLQLLKDFQIPRCYNTESLPPGTIADHLPLSGNELTYDLFGFSDGSNVAYAAVAYLRTTNSTGDPVISLIGAKTKVAPVKGETTPRLELNGARLLSKFLRTIIDSLKIPLNSVTCYSDSTSVLGQLHPKSKDLRDVYTRNRVRIIQDLLPTTPWMHVSGCENPADCCSRGISARDFLNHELYFQGPAWLKTVVPPPSVSYSGVDSFQISKAPNFIAEYVKKCSSIFKMKRVISQVMRAKNKFMKISSLPKTSPLSPMELQIALLVVIRAVQEESFPDEIRMLKEDSDIRSNKIRSLAPFLDRNGIVRVGGRISNAKILPDSKHPILLPKAHHFTKTLAKHYHLIHLHAGPCLLHSLLSEKFWIVGGPALAKKTVRSCITCWKARPRALEQKMSDLPEARVNLDRPFFKTGMDFCGHFTLCVTPGRNPRLTKSYVCVYVCMATKAVHLELVGNLTTSAFIASLKRFVSRRGKPLALYSDLGSNFVGAKKELERINAFIHSQDFTDQVTRYTTDEEIQFHFNPALSPHHGGLWEAAVKSTKHHLTRVVGDRHLSHEEFSTLLTQVEATLNSRPLLPMSTDPTDFNALTPAHFIIGSSLNTVPEEDLTNVKENRLDRWQRTERLFQDFRRRFHADYLRTLQSRTKWTKGIPNIPIGSLVLVKESDNLLTDKWNLARISNTFPGKDGRVRVVEIRTPNGNLYRRPITKIAPLPIEE